MWKGVDVAQETWEASCLAWPAWNYFPQCPRPCQLHSGRGDSSGAHDTKWLAWHQRLTGSWALPHVVQTLITQTLSQANPTAITAEEYFNPNFELGNRDMGRPMELTTKTQK